MLVLTYFTVAECNVTFIYIFKNLKTNPSYLIVIVINFPAHSGRSINIYALFEVFFTWWINRTFKTAAIYQVVSVFLHFLLKQFAAALIYLQKTTFLLCYTFWQHSLPAKQTISVLQNGWLQKFKFSSLPKSRFL